jgi:uncharacterized protein (TIGR03084 family)
MGIVDELEAEEDRLEGILAELDDDAWAAPSAAVGWSVADVVLHLAQSEEAVVASVSGGDAFATLRDGDDTVDGGAEAMVQAERGAPSAIFERWRTARRQALAGLREADPAVALPWVGSPLKPDTLATTRLAEHWAHGIDITDPLGVPFPDGPRLRHIAWLAHRTLPYAFALEGEEPQDVRCELTAPDGTTWSFGPEDAASTVRGAAGAFCRVAAQRLRPEDSGLVAGGPAGATALRVVRTYAF